MVIHHVLSVYHAKNTETDLFTAPGCNMQSKQTPHHPVSLFNSLISNNSQLKGDCRADIKLLITMATYLMATYFLILGPW